MIAILSPAKRMEITGNIPEFTLPTFLSDAGLLMKELKSYNSANLQKLMGISPKLADLNFDRNQKFQNGHSEKVASQAIFAFKGDVYVGLDASSLDPSDIDFAQQHLRILSGLYGILRPLDLIQAYRLEMGTKLKNPRGNTLYEFWKNILTDYLNKDIQNSKSDILVNLASDEYYKVLNKNKIKAEIIKIVFKEYKGDKLKFISFNAKKARGLMSRYIIKNKINDKESLKGFDSAGYYFDDKLSTENELWFIR